MKVYLVEQIQPILTLVKAKLNKSSLANLWIQTSPASHKATALALLAPVLTELGTAQPQLDFWYIRSKNNGPSFISRMWNILAP